MMFGDFNCHGADDSGCHLPNPLWPSWGPGLIICLFTIPVMLQGSSWNHTWGETLQETYRKMVPNRKMIYIHGGFFHIYVYKRLQEGRTRHEACLNYSKWFKRNWMLEQARAHTHTPIWQVQCRKDPKGKDVAVKIWYVGVCSSHN